MEELFLKMLILILDWARSQHNPILEESQLADEVKVHFLGKILGCIYFEFFKILCMKCHSDFVTWQVCHNKEGITQ